jgi:hypothetical protein
MKVELDFLREISYKNVFLPNLRCFFLFKAFRGSFARTKQLMERRHAALGRTC